MKFNVYRGTSSEHAPACSVLIGHVWVDHLGLSPEEQAVRALALAKAAYAGECHCPAVAPE